MNINDDIMAPKSLFKVKQAPCFLQVSVSVINIFKVADKIVNTNVLSSIGFKHDTY